MFNDCDFINGSENSLVVIVPAEIPKGEKITLRVHEDTISFFKSGEILFGRVVCNCQKTLRNLRKRRRVGLIEAVNGRPSFPVYISATARVERVITDYALNEEKVA